MRSRTTLRPVDSAEVKERASDTQGSATPSAGGQSASMPAAGGSAVRLPLVAGGLIAGGVALVLVLVLVTAARPATPVVPEVAAAPPVVATASACPAIVSFLDVITAYERQGRWGLAASAAQTALRTPGLCEADRAALAQKQVSLSREALFEQPPSLEDAPGQRRVAAAYADLKSMAGQYGLALPPPLPIARSAYDNRLFLLATAAYADAFTSGESSVDDRELVRADYAAQRNIGEIWANRSDGGQRQEGLARLATACRINERIQLGSPEACDDLRVLLGPREKWPPPLADPLIDIPLVNGGRGQ
jgi:hypothetical protein